MAFGTPNSPGSWMPLLLPSSHTKSPIVPVPTAAALNPASMSTFRSPELNVIRAVRPVIGSGSLSLIEVLPAAFCGLMFRPGSATNSIWYWPGATLNRNRPVASVVCVATMVPTLFSRLTTTPASPPSPLSWMPLPFRSFHAKSPMITGTYAPASMFAATSPMTSVIWADWPVLGSTSLLSAAVLPAGILRGEHAARRQARRIEANAVSAGRDHEERVRTVGRGHPGVEDHVGRIEQEDRRAGDDRLADIESSVAVGVGPGFAAEVGRGSAEDDVGDLWCGIRRDRQVAGRRLVGSNAELISRRGYEAQVEGRA